MTVADEVSGGVDGSRDGCLGTSTLVQILSGQVVGNELTSVRCTGCREDLDAGDIVFAYATRCIEQCRWDVPRLYCWGCAPGTVCHPTLGVAEVIVGGRLGQRSSPTTRAYQLCLTELAVRAYSPHRDGG